jgi:hypothetical protein
MLDGGAHLSYIAQHVAEALGLETKGIERQNVGLFGGKVEEKIMQKCEVKLKTKENFINVPVLQLPAICDPVPAITLGSWRDRIHQEKLKLADGVETGKGERWDGRIDILIGTQDYYTIVRGRSFALSIRLKAIETVFGWVVHGKLDHFEATKSNHTVLVATRQEEERIDSMLQRLFDLDAAHPLDQTGKEDDLALDHFRDTMRALEDG